MEEQITTIGTILLGAFYAIGYLLNRQAKKNNTTPVPDKVDQHQSEFLSSLSTTASQSTSLNVLLWERVETLENLQDHNQQEIDMLKQKLQHKDQLITNLQAKIERFINDDST